MILFRRARLCLVTPSPRPSGFLPLRGLRAALLWGRAAESGAGRCRRATRVTCGLSEGEGRAPRAEAAAGLSGAGGRPLEPLSLTIEHSGPLHAGTPAGPYGFLVCLSTSKRKLVAIRLSDCLAYGIFSRSHGRSVTVTGALFLTRDESVAQTTSSRGVPSRRAPSARGDVP